MNYLYLDSEFSSFYSSDRNKSGELLQLAIVPVINGEVKEPFNEMCKPLTHRWNPHAEKVHKISRGFAQQQQHPGQMAEKLLEFLRQYDCEFTCAGWSCGGDKNYIERLIADHGLSKEWYRRVKFKWRDVKNRMQERKRFFPVKNYKLETCAEFFQIPINAHDALSDADVTRLVDERLSTVKMTSTAVQLENQQLDNIAKKQKYTDRKYLQIGNGTVYISEHATQNPEAMRVIIEELWDVFVEGR